MKKLKPENGSTSVSLLNIALLFAQHGRVRFILHFAPIERTNHATLIAFQDGTLYRATGFTSGLSGDGPNGLLAIIKTYLERHDITIEHIRNWYGSKHLVLPGEGTGRTLYHLDEHTKVW